MLRYFTSVFIVLLSFATAGPTSASSDELVTACRVYIEQTENITMEKAIKGSHCFSYIYGYYDGWLHALYTAGAKSPICFPRPTWQQLAEVYVKWSSDHPEQRHLSNGETMTAAFVAAFPCAND